MKRIVILLAVPFSVQAALVGFNAGDGASASGIVSATLGADFSPAQSDVNALGGQYITSETDGAGDGPGTAARVVSYEVAFAEAGTYDLYARVWIGATAGADDSFFYGNGFGTQASLTASANWVHINGLYDTQEPKGNIEKYVWINFSQAKGADWAWGESGVSFLVTSAGARTIQVGAREDGLRFDAFAFGTSGETFSEEELDAAVVLQPATISGQFPAPNSDLSTEAFPLNLSAVLVDGTVSVEPGSVEMFLDGTALPLDEGDVEKAGVTTTVRYFVPSMVPGVHSVSLLYEGSSAPIGPYTNTWEFSVEIPVEMRVVIIGDSTVQTYPTGDRHGWGQDIYHYFDRRVEFENFAHSGESTSTFICEGWWDTAKASLQENDYLLIQFGHNDSHNPIYSEATDAFGDFQSNLQFYIDEATAIGAIPVLITPMHRNSFDGAEILSYYVDDTGYANDLLPYATAMQQVAVSNGLACIDLFSSSGEYMERLGTTACSKLMVDVTHWNEQGAVTMSALIAQGLSDQVSGLYPYLRGGVLKQHGADVLSGDFLRPIIAIDPEASVFRIDWFNQASGTYLQSLQEDVSTNVWRTVPEGGAGTAGSVVIMPDRDVELFRVVTP